jgi:hypothetical protein
MLVEIDLLSQAFGPDEIACMVTAYEDALRELNLTSRNDPMTKIIAKKIIELAQNGKRDPVEIRRLALAQIGIPSPE